jgi:hypothetical protein
MKAFFLGGSIFFTVLILILAFENIGAACQNFLFLFTSISQDTSPFFIVMGIAFLGGIAGFFYTGFVKELLKPDEDEEG